MNACAHRHRHSVPPFSSTGLSALELTSPLPATDSRRTRSSSRNQCPIGTRSRFRRLALSPVLALALILASPERGSSVTNGYITAVLRSDCTSAPSSPPPVGETAVGRDYVIRTVADGDPLDYEGAQQIGRAHV